MMKNNRFEIWNETIMWKDQFLRIAQRITIALGMGTLVCMAFLLSPDGHPMQEILQRSLSRLRSAFWEILFSWSLAMNFTGLTAFLCRRRYRRNILPAELVILHLMTVASWSSMRLLLENIGDWRSNYIMATVMYFTEVCGYCLIEYGRYSRQWRIRFWEDN